MILEATLIWISLDGQARAAEQYRPGQTASPSSTVRPTDFIEQEILGFRLWMILAFVFAGISVIVVVLCCMFDCRIPRTKQEIDADYERKQLAKKFTSEMSKIPPGQQFRVLRAARQPGPTALQNAGLYSSNQPRPGGEPQPGPSSSSHASPGEDVPLAQQPRLLMKTSALNQLQRPLSETRMRPGQTATAKTLASMSKQQANTDV